jgi:hypothetical protein
MTKADKIKQYNIDNQGYNITNIKKMTTQDLAYYRTYGKQSLRELYTRHSDAKQDSWDEIVRTYQPQEVLGMVGNSMTYSVLLVAGNGDTLHITKDNNYLVEVQ